MPIFGIDISHHQDLSLDLHRCKREGVEFAFLKATEGSSFVDSEFAANLREAREAGMLVAAYHYVRSNATAVAQVAHVLRHVPKNVPVIPDVEANSGGIELTRAFINGLKAAGYVVPLLYLPRWYWQQIGSPSLAGLPPLWSSRYPDNIVGLLDEEWADVPATYWNGYGGLSVAVLQFTSSARIAGHQPLDANAFRGNRSELAALFKEEEMALTNEELNNIWMFPVTGIGPDGKSQTHPAAVWITAAGFRLAGMDAKLDELRARPVADVEEDKLAQELANRGITGITPAEMKQIIQSVFADAGSDDDAGGPV